MKKLSIISISLLISLFAYSQTSPDFQVFNNSSREIVVEVKTKLPMFTVRKHGQQLFTTFDLNELSYVFVGEEGKPALPAIVRLIELPEQGNYHVEILQSKYEDYDLSSLGYIHPLYPFQPPIPKTGEVPFYYNPLAYRQTTFLLNKTSEIQYVGKLRTHPLGKFFVYPFDYLPARHVLRVYTYLQIKITFDQPVKHDQYDPLFDWITSRTINPSTSAKDVITSSPIKMVIVADSMFKTALQPFIAWKKKEGYKVIEAYRGTPLVGNSSASIRNYLLSLYNNATPQDPAPSYVVIVGDVAQVPPFTGTTGSHVTDLYYVEYTGDALPDAYIGRLSAQNITQLQNQLNKILEYEQYLFPTDTWLDSVVLIAGNDNTYAQTHGNGQINYAYNMYYNASHGLYSYVHLYPQTVDDATIRSEIGKGCSFANYTAHGSSSGWASPSFTVSHISSMNNAHKYPVMIGNACLTNKFDDNECFGEALLRAANKGAVAYIGGSNSTYWNEDFYWSVGFRSTITSNPTYDPSALGMYDRFWHEGLPYSDWFMSVSQMVLAGNLAVLQGSNMITYYSEVYHVMGDPSLMPYVGRPTQLIVNHAPFYPYGTTQITVTTEPFAYVGCTQNGQFLGAGFADANGNLTITFENLPDSGVVDIVGTKQFRKPYISQFFVGNANGPYVYFTQVNPKEISGHINQTLEYGEQFGFSMILKNFGLQHDTGVVVTCHVSSPYIQVIDSVYACGIIPSGDSLVIPLAFHFKIEDVTPASIQVPCTLNITDHLLNNWVYGFNINIKAPALKFTGVAIEDGNNRRLDPGETANINLYLKNTGLATIRQVHVDVDNFSTYIQLATSSVVVDSILPGQTKMLSFLVNTSSQTPLYTLALLKFTGWAMGYSDTLLYHTRIGALMEDFETQDFSRFDWTFNNVPWIITTDVVFEGTSAARSGIIGNSQTSQLKITLQVDDSDTLYFYKKVSSEASYDFLVFYLDGQLVQKWSGEVDWSLEKFLIPAGQHTFVWSYEKDFALSQGLDAAFIDNVVFPPIHVVTDVAYTHEEVKQIYPNPASQQIFLSPALLPAHLFFYSMDGRLLETISTDNSRVDISELPAGLHLMVVKSASTIHVFKLNITH